MSGNCEPGCQNGGICGAGTCICLPSFSGEFCERTETTCELPCQNEGICSEGKCICLPSYTGKQCNAINEGTTFLLMKLTLNNQK